METTGKKIRISLDEDLKMKVQEATDQLSEYHIAKVFVTDCINFYEERQRKFRDAKEHSGDGIKTNNLGVVSFPVSCPEKVAEYILSDGSVYAGIPDFVRQFA